MYIAVDDTDSRMGNCTTFLLTEFISELDDMDLIGNPRLVRLNPAVPWKTRGNGSLVMRVGKGIGEGRKIGEISGKDILCFSEAVEWEPDKEQITERLSRLVQKYRSEGSDPGLIVSTDKPDISLYWSGVRTILEKEYVLEKINKLDAKTYELGCGRGLIGAACGLAWEPGDKTFEVLAYRSLKLWGTERKYDPMSVREMDSMFSKTFNSWEERKMKVTMIPSTPCPVLFGLRGDDETETINAAAHLRTEKMDRWMTFMTNQGTDDHIIFDADNIMENQSYYIEGTVTGPAKHARGGHTFIEISTIHGNIVCGAYEPSKEFRMAFDRLIPGDIIGVMGELRQDPRTLNVEKMHILSLVERFSKAPNPVCPVCGHKMHSVGKDEGYRCKGCRTRSKGLPAVKEIRWIVPGWYEPPTSARRHLSKPLKRMGTEQPVEFVNCRMA